ncbi:hypothetical protein E2542_SST25171 [Spatholobus suberectus]|nr:hypothetical protein E2542_SST25171 [Spatholobus suberectus]
MGGRTIGLGGLGPTGILESAASFEGVKVIILHVEGNMAEKVRGLAKDLGLLGVRCMQPIFELSKKWKT